MRLKKNSIRGESEHCKISFYVQLKPEKVEKLFTYLNLLKCHLQLIYLFRVLEFYENVLEVYIDAAF